MKDDLITEKLGAIRHLAIDMDGTIYSGGTLFDCTKPFLATMRELGIGFTFLTNNSSKSARDYLAKLEKLDLDISADQLFTSGLATIEYLRANHPDYKRLFIVLTMGLKPSSLDESFRVFQV